MALSPGTRVGAYQIVALVGAGGMGEVYRAHDPRLGRDVAVKVLPERFSRDADRLRRFEQEARATGVLNHPNILAIYDVGTHEGSPYLVSEMLEGETLRQALTSGSIAFRRAIEYAVQAAAGLAAAHDKGLVHRDLKPENLFVIRDARVKILDFGLAKLIGAEQDNRSQQPTLASEPGMVLGTVGYMSPEQVRGQAVDHRSDIFSFGAILYEMLVGARAFQRGSAVETMSAILKDEPPDLKSKHGSIPPGLEAIVRRCLEKPPERRFQSASDLGFALETLSGSGMSRPEARAGSSMMSAPRHFWKATAAAVLAALILVVLAFTAGTRSASRGDGGTAWQGEILGGSAVALAPRISPTDGRLLAFQALIDNLTQVAVMTVDSGDWSIRTFRRDRGGVEELCWSNDGTQIYFDRVLERPLGIFNVPALGDGDERLILEDAMWPVAIPDKEGSLVVTKLNGGAKELYRFWPETQRLASLEVVLASVKVSPGVRPVPGGREVVFFGRPKASESPTDHLYAMDLASGSTRRLAPSVVFSRTDWYFSLAATQDEVLFNLPAGDLQQVMAAPLDGSESLRPVFTLTAFPAMLDVGPDGSIYADQFEQSETVTRFSPADDTVERFPIAGREPGFARVTPLPDGRFVVTRRRLGLERLMVMTLDGVSKPMIPFTSEETTGPMTLLGKDRFAFLLGSGATQSVAIATLDGRVVQRLSQLKDVQVLVGAPDGKSLYYVTGGDVWSIPVADGTPAEPRKIRPGVSVAVDPKGQYLVIEAVEQDANRLIRFTLPNGPEQPIPIGNGLRPGVLPHAMGPHAVASDGRIAVVVAANEKWNWLVAILDPRTGHGALLPLGFDRGMVSPNWDSSGRLVFNEFSTVSSLWRFRPMKR